MKFIRKYLGGDCGGGCVFSKGASGDDGNRAELGKRNPVCLTGSVCDVGPQPSLPLWL